MPTNCAQPRPRVRDEVQDSATDDQVELATELERLQLCMYDMIQPRTSEGKHFGASVAPDDGGNKRAKQRGNPPRAAPDIENAVSRAWSRQVDDGRSLSRQHQFAQSVRETAGIARRRACVKLGCALDILHESNSALSHERNL